MPRMPAWSAPSRDMHGESRNNRNNRNKQQRRARLKSNIEPSLLGIGFGRTFRTHKLFKMRVVALLSAAMMVGAKYTPQTQMNGAYSFANPTKYTPAVHRGDDYFEVRFL